MKNMKKKVGKGLGAHVVEKDQSELIKILGKEHYLKYLYPSSHAPEATGIPEDTQPTAAEEDFTLLKGIMPPKYHPLLQKQFDKQSQNQRKSLKTPKMDPKQLAR